MTLEEARNAIDAYQNEHKLTKAFLFNVLSNSLIGAIGSADKDSIKILPDITKYVWNRLPSNIWGSPEKVADHLNARK